MIRVVFIIWLMIGRIKALGVYAIRISNEDEALTTFTQDPV